jgi:hypothetical protein
MKRNYHKCIESTYNLKDKNEIKDLLNFIFGIYETISLMSIEVEMKINMTKANKI